MRSRQIETYKRQLKIRPEQHETLVGLLLGDGCLETQNQGRTYRLKIEQAARHETYVKHLHSAFAEWVLTPPRERQVVRNGVTTRNIRFQTVSHAAFRVYGAAYYAGRTKKVPDQIEEWLTPRALAYWFMDDGSMKSRESKGVILNTQAFCLSGIERLVAILTERFGLIAQRRFQDDGYQIYISGFSFESFREVIDPYLTEDMRYKLPQARRTELPKR